MAVNDIVMGAAGNGGLATYIEDVFSTWLYTSSGSNRSIVNNIDLSTKGGMVLFKGRDGSGGNYGWGVFDTNRGVQKALRTNTTEASFTSTTSLTAFNADGFNLGVDNELYVANAFGSGGTASWTFRKQPKFFDIVTYTGTGANRTIAHNLGSIPGCIMIKRTDTAADWQVYHRSLANTEYIVLNSGSAKVTSATRWNSTTPTSSVFSLGTDATVNASGGTYVAYIYAHNAGGFGLSGNENVISCGSYVGNGSTTGPTITLGYEPQWVMIKSTDAAHWFIVDSMRGFTVNGLDASLYPSLNSTEDIYTSIYPTATGFGLEALGTLFNSNGVTYIYMTIRRPMKTPTTGTSVFMPTTYTGNNAAKSINVGFAADLVINPSLNQSNNDQITSDRLRGFPQILITRSTGIEQNGGSNYVVSATNTNVNLGAAGLSVSGATYVDWAFRRAAGFFDVVCYTGTGVTFSPQHNLAAIPDLVICKRRNGADSWFVYANGFGGNNARLNSPDSFGSVLNRITAATSTTFTVAGPSEVNQSGNTYVAYLFATVAGVSKVGSYTGNGSSQTINCSFTTGARFIMIKRTDSTGDWYVWDTARGIVAGNDPHLSLNTSADQVTTDDSVDADSSGFIVNQLAATNININAASYIFLAIA